MEVATYTQCGRLQDSLLDSYPSPVERESEDQHWKWAIAQGMTCLPIGLACCTVSPVDLLSPPSRSAQNPILGPHNTTRVRSFLWPYGEDQWNMLVRRTSSCRHFDRSRQFFFSLSFPFHFLGGTGEDDMLLDASVS